MRPPLIFTSAFRVAPLTDDSDVAVLQLRGELDGDVAPRTFALLATQLTTHPHLLLCLRHLRHIDADGLSGLLGLCERATHEGSDLELFGPVSPQVHRALDTVKLNSLVQPGLANQPA